MKKIAILVVVYKELLHEVITFKSLLEVSNVKDVHFYIWDNSPLEFSQIPLSEFIANTGFTNVRYNRTVNNEPLSKIYNKVTDYYINDNDFDFVCLFDQDSKLSPCYINEICSVDDKILKFLLLPRVISLRKKVISPRVEPMIKKFFSADSLGDTELFVPNTICESKSFFAVGSGMVLSSTLWKTGLRFDEKLSFYGVDKEFCIMYAQGNEHFYLLNATIEHDISHENREMKSVILWRYDNVMMYRKYQYMKYTNYHPLLINIYFKFHRLLKIIMLKFIYD